MPAKVFVHSIPNPGKPRLLFAHGLGIGHRMWLPQFESLSDSFEIIAPDMPGLGQSSEAGPFTVERAAEVLSELVPSRADQPVYVIGLSLGATVALRMALDVPTRALSGLLLSACQVRPPRFLMALQRNFVNLTPERLILKMSTNLPTERPELRRAAIEDMTRTGKRGFIEAMDAAGSVDFTDELRFVECPTLVACGGRDRVNLSAARALARAIPQARLRIIEGAGHVWNLEYPDRFNEVVRRELVGMSSK